MCPLGGRKPTDLIYDVDYDDDDDDDGDDSSVNFVELNSPRRYP